MSGSTAVVTLADIADIRRTFKSIQRGTPVSTASPAIAIEVIKRIGTNIVENNEQGARGRGNTKTANWPETILVDFAVDESTTIFEVLGSLQSAILTAIALVMIVVWRLSAPVRRSLSASPFQPHS